MFNPTLPARVGEYLALHQERFIADLCAYARFPSVSAQPKHKPDVQACAQWIANHANKAGLTSEIRQTAGNPIVLAKTPPRPGKRPHFLVYGHYDVQPAEPFDLWTTPPFDPQRRGNALYARGICDNKGQHLAHLHAVEAYLKTDTELPCDLTFVIEGEEEVGSDQLGPFLKKYRNELACKAVVISDTGIPSLKQPALTCALRGITAFEITVRGPNRDLHSGIFGGSVDNPALVLAEMLAKVRDSRGKIKVPGFYEGVMALKASDRKEMARLKIDPRKEARFLGVKELHGESGFSIMEQRGARPTFEINGLTSGYQGDGSKTIIPSWAKAKITCRLVPSQKPDKVRNQVAAFLKKIAPKTVEVTISPGHGGEAYYVSPDSAHAKAALRTLKAAFGHDPVLLREGGSIPIVNEIRKILGVDTLLLGLALPDDNAHSPNEKFDLECYRRGMQMSAMLWPELTAAFQK